MARTCSGRGSGCAVRGATRRVAVAASTPRMWGEKAGGPAGPCAPLLACTGAHPAHHSRRPRRAAGTPSELVALHGACTKLMYITQMGGGRWLARWGCRYRRGRTGRTAQTRVAYADMRGATWFISAPVDACESCFRVRGVPLCIVLRKIGQKSVALHHFETLRFFCGVCS